MIRGCVAVDLCDRLFVSGDVSVVADVPRSWNEPLEASAGTGVNSSEQHFHVFIVPFETPRNVHQSVNIIFGNID